MKGLKGLKYARALALCAALLFSAFPSSGCAQQAPASPPKPALTDVQIGVRVDAIVAEYLEALGLDGREVIFSVDDSVEKGVVTITGETSDGSLKQALLDKVSAIEGVTVVDKVLVLPPPEIGEETYAIVAVPVLNLGDRPHSSGGSHTVTQARMGDILRLLKERDGWFLAQMEDNYLGWVDPESIFRCDRAFVDGYREGPVVIVTAKTAPVLDSPGGRPVFEQALVQGSVLAVVETGAEWTKVKVPESSEGWIETFKAKAFPALNEAFSEKKGAEGVIATAKEFIGLPYLWGGTTAYGFDCSGLTQYAMKMNGYRIRRDADMQFEEGEEVKDRADLIPGDLVFFQTYKKGPSHVGIYIGDSQYIQSGGKTGLTIQSFDPSHPNYLEELDHAYLGARRVIK